MKLRIFLEQPKALAQPRPLENDDLIALRLKGIDRRRAEPLLDILEVGPGLRHTLSIPFKGPFFPDVNKTDEQHSEKDPHLYHAEPPQPAKQDRPGIEKHHFEIEN